MQCSIAARTKLIYKQHGATIALSQHADLFTALLLSQHADLTTALLGIVCP